MPSMSQKNLVDVKICFIILTYWFSSLPNILTCLLADYIRKILEGILSISKVTISRCNWTIEKTSKAWYNIHNNCQKIFIHYMWSISVFDFICQSTVLSTLCLLLTCTAHDEHMSKSSCDPEWQNNYLTHQIPSLSLYRPSIRKLDSCPPHPLHSKNSPDAVIFPDAGPFRYRRWAFPAKSLLLAATHGWKSHQFVCSIWGGGCVL